MEEELLSYVIFITFCTAFELSYAHKASCLNKTLFFCSYDLLLDVSMHSFEHAHIVFNIPDTLLIEINLNTTIGNHPMTSLLPKKREISEVLKGT